MIIPRSHPRYASLVARQRIEHGVALGITSPNGLIAHGRGEAFDYLLGETTHPFAKQAIRQAALRLTCAKHPVLSVNGNTAALVPKELIALSRLLHAPLEINLFHTSQARIRRIEKYLKTRGATTVLLPNRKYRIPGLASARRFVHPDGIYAADVVLVPLEDGDRTQALVGMGKQVITIDLNPLSRTAIAAHVTIVDNILRALPLLLQYVKKTKVTENGYENSRILKEAEICLRRGGWGR